MEQCLRLEILDHRVYLAIREALSGIRQRVQDESNLLLHVSTKLPPSLLVRFEPLKMHQNDARKADKGVMEIMGTHAHHKREGKDSKTHPNVFNDHQR